MQNQRVTWERSPEHWEAEGKKEEEKIDGEGTSLSKTTGKMKKPLTEEEKGAGRHRFGVKSY